MRYEKNTPFVKLLIICQANVRDAANSWFESNIRDAGSNAISAPYSDDGENLTHYVSYWRIENSNLTAVTDYIDRTYDGSEMSWSRCLPSDVGATLDAASLTAYDPLT